MSEARRVVWDVDAQADLVQAIEYVGERNPMAALRAAERLDAQACSLSHQAHRGRRVPEWVMLADLRDLVGAIDLRELVLRPWRMIYVVEPRRVRVVALVDSRRDMVAWLERHVARIQ